MKVTSTSVNWARFFSDNGVAVPEAEGAHQLNAGFRKGTQKSFYLKVRIVKDVSFCCSTMKSYGSPFKWFPEIQGGAVSSTNQGGPLNRGKPRRRWKNQNQWYNIDLVVSRNIFSSQHKKSIASLQDGSYSQKCYRLPMVFKERICGVLDHVGLGHVPRLTRIEWGVIRSTSSISTLMQFSWQTTKISEQFLIEEKNKLNQYRESVRSHYAEILSGTKEGLPTDLAQPLIVGSVLTSPELGVEFVMDIDCMPLYPFENMPTSLIQHNISSAQINQDFIELKPNGKLKQRKVAGHTILSPSENLDTIKNLHIPPTMHGSSTLSKQVFSSSSKSQPKVVCSEIGIGNAQLASSSQPSLLDHVHSKEADILAISELNRALDKKELVLSELKHMNDGVSESQKYGDNSVKDSEPFKRNYASVLKQLTEANEQVSSALFCLRQRNTYQASSSVLSLKPMANFDDPSGQASSSNCSACHNQESISQSHITEIVESSRRKARMMVVQATQAMSNLRKTESKKCTERQFPPADVAQVLDSAVTSLQPLSLKNLPIYGEIQKCMGIIRNQILALIPT
ncbi:hypothetical protein GYH30_046020 [Glycine max]|nr:hypothetical protein GYH30_046020 [Glycine max]